MLNCDIHTRARTKKLLLNSGAEKVISLDEILTKVEELFPVELAVEFTVESGRPDSITREKLQVLRNHGISRISINPQTMKQATLDLIGRRHTVEDVKEKFLLARELGFDNINMDLIVGLPEETIDDVRQTMEEIKALRPDSVTVHSLAIKRAARLNIYKERYGNLKIVNTQEMIDLTAQYAEEKTDDRRLRCGNDHQGLFPGRKPD